MASIRVEHTIGDLQSDLRKIATAAPKAFVKVVREGARVGNDVAKSNARRTAGAHGKWYPGTFTVGGVSMFYGFGGGNISAEYGPVAGRRQGGMRFEYGSRNQPPHLDLAKSADLIGPAFANEARDAAADLFWPAS